MTTRTVQFYGQGYSVPIEGLGLTPCAITATVGGNVVFSGGIPTLESSDILRLPADQQILFTFEIPLITTGNAYTIPVSLALTGDDIYLEQIDGNYCNYFGNTTGPTGFSGLFNGEARSNVVVTNATYSNPPPDPRPPGTEGTWGWEVETAPGQTSTMTFDMNVTPGLE
jgi:hypothetical protein